METIEKIAVLSLMSIASFGTILAFIYTHRLIKNYILKLHSIVITKSIKINVHEFVANQQLAKVLCYASVQATNQFSNKQELLDQYDAIDRQG
jgi:hypothetical protein